MPWPLATEITRSVDPLLGIEVTTAALAPEPGYSAKLSGVWLTDPDELHQWERSWWGRWLASIPVPEATAR